MAVNAAGPVSLTSSGDLNAGAVATTAGDLSIASSAGTVGLNSSAQASGSVTIAGRSLALGGTHSAGGGYTATASAGAITGGNGLSILSDATGSGNRPLALSATGGAVQLGAAPLSGGRGGSSDVTITTDGGGVTVGDVVARRLAVTGPAGSAAAITTGALRLSGDLSLAAAGGVTTGTIDTGTGAVSIDGEPRFVGDDLGLYSVEDDVDCSLEPQSCTAVPDEPVRVKLDAAAAPSGQKASNAG